MEIKPAYSFYIQNMMQKHHAVFSEGFEAWLHANWGIYLEFERQANLVALSGRKHYGARTIIEYMRHQTMFSETNSEFKLNNNSIPDLARVYGIRNPAHAGIFEYRVTKNHKKHFEVRS